MKLSAFILIISLMQVSAATFGQRLTLQEKNVSIEKVFREIRKQTGLNILMENTGISLSKRMNVNFKDASMEEVLPVILSNEYEYLLQENTILVKEKEKSILDKISNYFATIDVYGKVVDENDSPLGGATIMIKATGKGVSAKADGNFSISNTEEGTILVITFIGYTSKEVRAVKQLGVIKLEKSNSKLDEVQVKAYGVTSQRLNTGNITTITSTDIEKQTINNPLLALQGRVPGVDIIQSNGLPGSGVTVRIQGQNSFFGGLDPLYVIDGVPYSSQTIKTIGAYSPLGNSNTDGGGMYQQGGAGNPMSFLNPYDIESISVLKDADATAIYGSRAANGAILVTTKKGKAGATKLSVNIQSGIGEIPQRVKLLNSQQYVDMRKEALKNDNITADNSNAFDILNLYSWDNTRTKDWQEEFLGGKSKYTNASMNISGGTQQNQYLIGGSYSRETTVSPGDFADVKGSAHISFNTASLDQRLKLQIAASYMSDNNKLQQIDIAGLALTLAPTAPEIYRPDGTLNWASDNNGNSTWGNPVASLNSKYQLKTNNLISSADLSYQIIPKLNIKVHGGYTITQSDEKSVSPNSALPPEVSDPYNGQSTFGDSQVNTSIVEPQINYVSNLGFGKLDLLIGSTFQVTQSTGKTLVAYGYSSDQVREDISSAIGILPLISAQSTYKYAAVFGRLSYSLKDRYLMNLTVRRDGSSRFGPLDRLHTFGAIGLGWIFSDEEFSKRLTGSVLSFGKIKASFGTTGSDQTGDYSFYDLYASNNYAIPYQGLGALAVTQLYNPYRHWELTKKLNIGADFGFFKDRILLNVNYVLNRSHGLLTPSSLPYTAGFVNITSNLDAVIQNTSLQASLTTQNIITKNFSWTTNIDFTLPKNKLVEYNDFIKSPGGYIVGKPLDYGNSLFYRFAGVNPETGSYLFYAADNGITSTPTNASDQIYISKSPVFMGGISNTFSYKTFQLSLFVQYVNKKMPGWYGGDLPAGSIASNKPENVLNRWQNPGDMAINAKYSTSLSNRNSYFYNSDAIVIDGSFIRLRTVSLSWGLPENLRTKLKIKDGKIFFNAQNLFVLSKYQGLDPETGNGIPPLRVVMLGVQLGL